MSLPMPHERSGPLKREQVEALVQRLKDPGAARQFLMEAGLIDPDGQLAAPYRQPEEADKHARIRAQSRSVAQHIQNDPQAQDFINDWAGPGN